MPRRGTETPPPEGSLDWAAALVDAAEGLVDAEIENDIALGELLDADEPNENERCRDRQKETARARDEALSVLAALFGKRWPTA